VIARNRRRVKAAASIGVNNYRLSANGLHYSWDWGRVHLAMLNLYPGNQGKGSQGSALNSPSYSLQFLVEDLKRVDPSAPVILFFHYPLRGSMAFPHVSGPVCCVMCALLCVACAE
jgi:cytolysin (calcineurin-like family phosphatase)